MNKKKLKWKSKKMEGRKEREGWRRWCKKKELYKVVKWGVEGGAHSRTIPAERGGGHVVPISGWTNLPCSKLDRGLRSTHRHTHLTQFHWTLYWFIKILTLKSRQYSQKGDFFLWHYCVFGRMGNVTWTSRCWNFQKMFLALCGEKNNIV